MWRLKGCSSGEWNVQFIRCICSLKEIQCREMETEHICNKIPLRFNVSYILHWLHIWSFFSLHWKAVTRIWRLRLVSDFGFFHIEGASDKARRVYRGSGGVFALVRITLSVNRPLNIKAAYRKRFCFWSPKLKARSHRERAKSLANTFLAWSMVTFTTLKPVRVRYVWRGLNSCQFYPV